MKRFGRAATAVYVILALAAVLAGLKMLLKSTDSGGKIIAYSQNPDWQTGCESVSLYILLRYYRVDVTVRDIVDVLPREPMPFEEDGVLYGGNPERGFVSSPSDPNSYGVLNEPIAAAANLFLGGAVAESGLDTGDVEEILGEGIPLIVWVSMYPDREPKITCWTDAETGEEVTWIGGEHAVVVYGVGESGFKVSDPKTGTLGVISKEDFAAGFERHGGRVVYYPKQ